MFALDDDIIRQLRATFKVEADEHIQAMNRILLALEKGPAEEERVQLLEEIFREAHSLKGAAGAVDLDDVESTAHRLESVFFATKSGEVALTPDLCDVLYDAIDAVSTVVTTALADQPHGLNLAAVHERLDAAQQGQVLPVLSKEQGGGNTAVPLPTDPEPEPEPEPQPEPAPAPKSAASGSVTVEETIRVATNKLDSLMTQTGELLVAGLKIDQRLQETIRLGRALEDLNREWLKIRSSQHLFLQHGESEELRPLLKFLDRNQQQLKTLTSQVNTLARTFASDALHLSRVTDELGESVMKVRMLPVSTVLDMFPRMVRDLAREKGKEIEFVVAGGDTELDRKVLEEIKDPLVHILRNAVDHGIEEPDVRAKAGKPRQGTIIVRAFQKGNSIIIQVTDDGGGINVKKVTQSALKAGIISTGDLETLGDDEAMRLIFASGLSTSPIITDISGRGVGMDVVRKNIEKLHGHIDLESTLGQGTEMTLVLPLTLATTQELLVEVNEQTFGIPIAAVERIQRIQHEEIHHVEGKEAILIDNEPVSLVHLADVLELGRGDGNGRVERKMPVVILGAGKWRIAFLVDAVVGQQESVVKSLGRQLSRVRNVTGATILGTGKVIMTLNPTDLLKSARGVKGYAILETRMPKGEVEKARQRKILVVDDSMTTRNLEKTILETAGYQVQVATDGMEALQLLQTNGSCDLVVSDVLMPNMDGFQLTAAIRNDAALKEIPVILVTSLEKREDKEKGIEVGADAYIVKSTFDQAGLLQTIEQLV
ncbi:MAG: hybrid sensor histidine kinase/response regulator [Ardenticatenaceae bacterium]|nr:hybrid sensor histidine kinase/response regulator [Ardenticatenaceae bacterium]MCB9444363.1 hybrid sensor histidine kinase/response regulator [Ardenticatenaceae bacterium]